MKKLPEQYPDAAILLIHCPDREGLVASITDFIYKNGGNIIDLEQHVDAVDKVFFMRVEWDIAHFTIPRKKIGVQFQSEIADRLSMKWSLHFADEVPRMAIFVSRLPHCLFDILSRCQSREWQAEVPLIVSNHVDLEPIAKQFGVDYRHVPITAKNKQPQEQAELELLKQYKIEFIVLARYMQVMTEDFIRRYPNRIINIHHSFLPAFPGSRPYHSAYERGVKVIGATSHYVTGDLDAGPIIEQDVVHVSHKDSIEDLVRIGRDLEKVVLSRAIWHHLKRKILTYHNRTVIFS